MPSVWLSNVTLWVPASEFSFLRSHVTSTTNSFSIDLAGGQSLQFSNVHDLGADGLYIQHFTGPGMEADSLKLRMEAGWNQDGPPRGFWNTGTPPAPSRMSDVVVVVLAVCLVTAVVISVLACLAYVFWRRRSAEAKATAAAELAELGKAGYGHRRAGSSNSERSSQDLEGSGSLNGSHCAAGQTAVSTVKSQLRVADPAAPVHDSSDSYHLTDRAQLTADLARSQFGASRHMQQGDGDRHGEAALGRKSVTLGAGAQEAALHRLHSAITTMSQDVLSRRLQVTNGGLAAAGSAAGSALARPSPLRALDAAAGGGNSPHAAAGLAQDGLARSSAGASAGSSHSHQGQQQQNGDAPAGSHNGQQQQLTAGDPAAGAPASSRGKPRSAVATASVGGLTAGGSSMSDVKALGELKLLQLVGQGTFGQVYKALWRRRCVAVKVLQLPATAGGSDAAAPWMGVGRVSSHREKMAVMETVVSTTMSHPNIVQVYTYVLQPLLSAQGGSVQSGSSKWRGNANGTPGQPEDKHAQQQWLLQQEQQQLQQIGGQLEQQDQQQDQLRPQHALLAAAAKLQEQQQQEQLEQPDPGQQEQQQQPLQIPPDPGAHVGTSHAVDPPTAAAAARNGGLHMNNHRRTSSGGHSVAAAADLARLSQSLGGGDLTRLTPEMAAAAAAALPGAAAAGNSSGSSRGNDGEQDGHSEPPGPVLVGWELRLVMEFCDAVSQESRCIDRAYLSCL